MIACWACCASPVRSPRVDVVTEPKVIYKHESTPLRSLFYQMAGNWGSVSIDKSIMARGGGVHKWTTHFNVSLLKKGWRV